MLSYKKGVPLARIRQGKHSKVLKYDDGEEDYDMDDPEYIERFGFQKKKKSLVEKLLDLSEEDLVSALNTDPTLRSRIKEEMNNKDVPSTFTIANSTGAEKNLWQQSVHIEGARFVPTVNPYLDREIIYIYGPSGSGKSSLCRSYIIEYRKEFPSNKIYLFTLKDSDTTLDDLNVSRVPNRLDVLKGIDIDTMRDTMLIFDDCDTIDPDFVNEIKEIRRIMDSVAQRGRDRRIYCIVTTHLACKGKETKMILNESNKYIVFPKKSPKRAIDYLCNQYVSLSPKDVQKIMDLKSRWVCIDKNLPRHVMYENGLYTLA